jgi:hypothetical protein
MYTKSATPKKYFQDKNAYSALEDGKLLVYKSSDSKFSD